LTIKFRSPLQDCNPENDNVDVAVTTDDGRTYTLIVATPNNILWCMDNEGLDYFFGSPMIFVKRLTNENVERAIRAIVSEDDGKWLSVYGA
jgi:hypothetical protein